MSRRPRKPKIASPRGRSVDEWIGKTPDERPPPHVRLRIFDRANGVCHISGRKIAPGEAWEAEHVIAQADGGENRESNMAPALVEPHKGKSAAEAADRAKVRDKRKKHLGIKAAPRQPIKSRGFQPSEAKDRRLKKELPARVGGIRFVDDD